MGGSMNWLGFSLSPHDHHQQQQQQQQQQQVAVVATTANPSISHHARAPHHGGHQHDQTATTLGFNYYTADAIISGGNCFDVSSHDDSVTTTTSTTTMNNHLPASSSFGMLHHLPSSLNPNNIAIHSQQQAGADWNHHLFHQQPKLENFLGGRHSFFADHHDHHGRGSTTTSNSAHAYTNNTVSPLYLNGSSSEPSSNNNNNNIGLSMIKTWLRNQPAPPPHGHPPSPNNTNHRRHHHQDNKNDTNSTNYGTTSTISSSSTSSAQTLSLSMSTGGSHNTHAPTAVAASAAVAGETIQYCPSPHHPASTPAAAAIDSQMSSSSGTAGVDQAAVPKKSVDTFGQRTSIYRGVTRHRWTGRYEAHLWDNSCRREGQTRKGRQVYLGGYDKEEKAARAYDLAALKYWGTTTTTNFPMSNYEKEVDEMKHMTRQEYVASLRRKSSGFSRGASIYRGVTRHHQHGRWQARIGRVAGNKDLYLGTFSTQEEAAEAYDVAAIKFRGLNAVTNFDMSRYDVKSILESSTLPIGGAAKRLKDAEQARQHSEMTALILDRSSSLTTDDHIMMGTGTATDRQYHQQLMMMSSSTNTSDHHHHNYVGTINVAAAAAANGWPTLAFNQAAAGAGAQPPLPFHGMPQYYSSVMPPYNIINGQRVWCKPEQQDTQSFYQEDHDDQHHNHHQLVQLGSTHDFFQLTAGGGGLMGTSTTTDSMEHSSGSNSVIYGNGSITTTRGRGDDHAGGYDNINHAASVVANHDARCINGFGGTDDHEQAADRTSAAFGYGNVFGSTSNNATYDAYNNSIHNHGRTIHSYDIGCSNWVPTAVPTTTTTTTPTFRVWNDT